MNGEKWDPPRAGSFRRNGEVDYVAAGKGCAALLVVWILAIAVAVGTVAVIRAIL